VGKEDEIKTVEIKKCPFYSVSDFIESMVDSYGKVILTAGVLRSDALYAAVCRDCGSVVRKFCKSPQHIVDKKPKK
jgi:hypothetical protein